MTQAPDGAEGLKTRPSRDEVEVEIDLSYPDADVTKYVISPKSTSAKKNYEGTVYYHSTKPAKPLSFGTSVLRSGGEPNGYVRVTNGGMPYVAENGVVSVPEGITVILEAVPAAGYKFSKWADGNTENPREYKVTADATGLTPEFVGKREASFALAGNSSAYNGAAQTVSVTGEGNERCQITFFFDRACTQPAILKNAGTYYVRVYRLEDDVYQAYEKTFEYTIERADAKVVWPTASVILSGHALAESVLQGGHAGIVAGTFAWSDPEVLMTAEGDKEVIFTPTDPNYKPQSSQVKVTVVSSVSSSTDPENPVTPVDPVDPENPEGPDTPTGVESIEEDAVLYAANLSILANMPKSVTLTVIDVAGFIVYKETVAGEVMIPVSHAGVYFVRCEVTGEVFVKKIVVH